jgi:hypothetical protein
MGLRFETAQFLENFSDILNDRLLLTNVLFQTVHTVHMVRPCDLLIVYAFALLANRGGM